MALPMLAKQIPLPLFSYYPNGGLIERWKARWAWVHVL